MAETAVHTRLISSLARRIEKLAAHAQGKGYGTATIARENALVHQLLGRTPVLAADIGGNVGEYTAELRRRHPALEIHVFEPSSTNIAKLRSRFGGDAGVHLVPSAVADEARQATLFADTSGSGMGSLANRELAHRGIAFSAQETVPVIRFDDYWTQQLARRPLDIVKIDIEGFELAALKGFGDALAATEVLQFEFGGCNIDTRSYFRDFWQFFQQRGFALYRITPFGLDRLKRYRESDEFFSTTNYVARRLSGGAAAAVSGAR
jgi:FkbM family methyltransferase